MRAGDFDSPAIAGRGDDDEHDPKTSTPIFKKDQIREIELLLEDLKERSANTVLSGGYHQQQQYPHQQFASGFADKYLHNSSGRLVQQADEAAAEEREKMWKTHIRNLEQYRAKRDAVLHESNRREREFRKANSKRPHRAAPTSQRNSTVVNQSATTARSFTENYPEIHGYYLEEFIQERLCLPTTGGIHLAPT